MKKTFLTNRIPIIFFVIFIIFMLFLFFVFSYQNTITTKIKTTKNENTLTEISCSSEDIVNDVLSRIGEPISQDHELRIVFVDNKMYSIFYMYNGKYKNEADAKIAESNMHADYNIFLQDLKIDINTYSPAYSIYDNNFKMSIYANNDQLSKNTASLFFLNNVELDDNLSSEKIKSLIEMQGFNCSKE